MPKILDSRRVSKIYLGSKYIKKCLRPADGAKRRSRSRVPKVLGGPGGLAPLAGAAGCCQGQGTESLKHSIEKIYRLSKKDLPPKGCASTYASIFDNSLADLISLNLFQKKPKRANLSHSGQRSLRITNVPNAAKSSKMVKGSVAI